MQLNRTMSSVCKGWFQLIPLVFFQSTTFHDRVTLEVLACTANVQFTIVLLNILSTYHKWGRNGVVSMRIPSKSDFLHFASYRGLTMFIKCLQSIRGTGKHASKWPIEYWPNAIVIQPQQINRPYLPDFLLVDARVFLEHKRICLNSIRNLIW